MAIRVTQQTVSVLGYKDSSLRLLMESIDVLGTSTPELRIGRISLEFLQTVPAATYEEAAQSTLSLLQTAFYAQTYEPPASNSLSLSHQAGFSPWTEVDCQSTLSLGQVVDYIGPRWLDAATLIELDSAVYIPQQHPASAVSQLQFAQEIVRHGTQRLAATTEILLEVQADQETKSRQVTTTLGIDQLAEVDWVLRAESQITLQEAAGQGILSAWAENHLDLAHAARPNPITIGPGPGYHHQLPPTGIVLTQGAHCSIRNVVTSSTLQLDYDVAVVKPIYASAQSELIETQAVYDPATVSMVELTTGLWQAGAYELQKTLTSVHYLQTAQQAWAVHLRADGVSRSADSTPSLSQQARLSEAAGAESQITLSHGAIGHVCEPAASELTLDQEVVVSVARLLDATTVIQLGDALAYVLGAQGRLCQYTPFVGGGSAEAPTPPPTALDPPLAGIEAPFQLVYPATGAVTDSVSLKAPDLGNKDRLSFNRIVRQTRGGTLVVYADPIWPKVQTLVLSFSGLSEVKAQALLQFMQEHLGQEVGLVDWEHRYWRGVITTPDEPVVQDGRDSFSASFEFQGELDPAWSPS